MKYGTTHPGNIDAVSSKDGKVILSLIQADDVDDSNILQLQEKLNNYLAFILDGQLDNEFPQYRGYAAKIEINFQFKPRGIAQEFLNKAVTLCSEEGIKLLYKVAT